MSKRWIIAQDAPGSPEHVTWSLVDTQWQGVRGHLLGREFAQEIADGLNAAEVPEEEPQAEPVDGHRLRLEYFNSEDGIYLVCSCKWQENLGFGPSSQRVDLAREKHLSNQS